MSKKTNLNSKNLISKGYQYQVDGDLLLAERYYSKALSKGYSDPGVISNLAIIYQQLGEEDKALSLYKYGIGLYPKAEFIYINLSNFLMDKGKLTEAEFYIRKALVLKPSLSIIYVKIISILSLLGKLDEAENIARQFIKSHPELPLSHLCLAQVLFYLGNLDQAEPIILNSIKLDPELAAGYHTLFEIYEKSNNLEALAESLTMHENNNVIINEINLYKARLYFRQKLYHQAKQTILLISDKWLNSQPSNIVIQYWSYRGFIEDKLANYDKAFYYFTKSQQNPLYSQTNPSRWLDKIQEYKNALINKSTTKTTNKSSDSTNYNIAFLLGFPRSGTTLLDTILRSHTNIDVIEEKPMLLHLESIIRDSFKIDLSQLFELTHSQIDYLRAEYLNLVSVNSPNSNNLIIDKLPLSTISIPLINILFPTAKILFSYRHPCDTVLSCMQQVFQPNDAMSNFVSLESSSIFYNNVMKGWVDYQRNLSFDYRMVRYESLISDYYSYSRDIIDFLGLPMDQNISNFTLTAKARGFISTPSSSQVTQSIYKDSILKWVNYKKHFCNSMVYLEEWISFFNYDT